MPTVKGCSILCYASLLETWKTQKQGTIIYRLLNFQTVMQVSSPSITLYSQRRQIAAKHKPRSYNKKTQMQTPILPIALGAWVPLDLRRSESTPLLSKSRRQLMCLMWLQPPAHGTVSSHSSGRTPSRWHQREPEQSGKRHSVLLLEN